jgi:N-acylneuraminate cytidylyltransferase
MKYFIIIKEHSERVTNKNFLDLGGKPLYKHLLDELKGEDVYIDTDSEKLYKSLKSSEVTCYKRSSKCINLEVDSSFKVSPALIMIDDFLDKYVTDENEVIVTPHVTSPFIKLSTINNAAKKLDDGYDSVLACTQHKEFTYFKGKPVNFNPEVVQKTQDLEPIVMGNGAFFIFTKKIFKEYNNRTGNNPYFYPITFPESVEIDYESDFELARRVYEK